MAAAFSLRAILVIPIGVHLTSRTVGTRARTYLRPYLVPATASAVMTVVVLGVGVLVDGHAPATIVVTKVIVGGVTYVSAVRVISADLSAEIMGLVRLARSSGADEP